MSHLNSSDTLSIVVSVIGVGSTVTVEVMASSISSTYLEPSALSRSLLSGLSQ